MINRPLLYIAGYYTANPAHGVANAASFFNEAYDKGWLPIIPHANIVIDMLAPQTAQFWYEYDLALLKRCDALFVAPDVVTRLSTGVSEEVTFAVDNNLPVYSDHIPYTHEVE